MIGTFGGVDIVVDPCTNGAKGIVNIYAYQLCELGVLRGKVSKLTKEAAFKPWYMHGTSHWLGRDVHDVGGYQTLDAKPEPLPVGSVLTVEPGLYFHKRDARVPAALRGIGIRIEDDVLVTKKGPEVLTDGVPKSIAAIERLMAQ